MKLNHYECRKCGCQFEFPRKEEIANIGTVLYHCPLCKSREFVDINCAHCDFYKSRGFPCGMGHRTIVPYNVSCDQWKIRNLNKPKVI